MFLLQAVDSLLWRRLLWPELAVLLFNTVENRSSEYGVLPWHWYCTRALPKALLGALPLCCVGVYLRPRRSLHMLLPSVAFVCLYSALPHKELRFVFHAVAPINCVAAAARQPLPRGHLCGRIQRIPGGNPEK